MLGYPDPDLFCRRLSSLDHRVEVTPIYLLGLGQADLGPPAFEAEQVNEGDTELFGYGIEHDGKIDHLLNK
jgi:hypothetical protein